MTNHHDNNDIDSDGNEDPADESESMANEDQQAAVSPPPSSDVESRDDPFDLKELRISQDFASQRETRNSVASACPGSSSSRCS